MVEDVLQASLPGFVDAVRVADIGQGTNPIRIVSMRAVQKHTEKHTKFWEGTRSYDASRTVHGKA